MSFTLADNFKFLTPGLNWKSILFGFTLGRFAFESYLGYRQYQVLKREEPPVALGKVDKETFEKSQRYSRAKQILMFFSKFHSFLHNVADIKFNVLSKFWSFSGRILRSVTPYLPKALCGGVSHFVVFEFIVCASNIVVGSPFSYYEIVVLENKYGCKPATVKEWAVSLFGTLSFALVFYSPIVCAFVKTIDTFGSSAIWFTCGLSLFTHLVYTTVYPMVFQPSFHKDALKEGELKTAIEEFAKKQGFPLSGIYVGGHSEDPYLTGMPWAKNIVLSKTTTEKCTVNETVALTTKIIRHWQLNHSVETLALTQVKILAVFSLFLAVLENTSLFHTFGFYNKPPIVAFTLFCDFLQPVQVGFKLVSNLMVRKHEYEACQYVKQCGYADSLASAWFKHDEDAFDSAMDPENLNYKDADWLYSAYYNPSPLLAERLGAIGYASKPKA